MNFVFIHGWGFDSKIWSPILSQINVSSNRVILIDKGYFHSNPVKLYSLKAPWVGICHSQGFSDLIRLKLNKENLSYLDQSFMNNCRGILGLSGFINFPDIENKNLQIISKIRSMMLQLSSNAAKVIKDFWEQSGMPHYRSDVGYINWQRLLHDLKRLLLKISSPSQNLDIPIINIVSEQDDILRNATTDLNNLGIQTLTLHEKSHCWFYKHPYIFHKALKEVIHSWKII